MSNNTRLNQNTTIGDLIGTEEISGVKYELVKILFGGDGIATKVDNTNALPVSFGKSSTSAVTSVADSSSNQTLLSLNTGRLVATIFNDSTEILYLKLGAIASLTSFTVKIQPDGYYELPQPIYTGIIDGIWANNASGAARITELTT